MSVHGRVLGKNKMTPSPETEGDRIATFQASPPECEKRAAAIRAFGIACLSSMTGSPAMPEMGITRSLVLESTGSQPASSCVHARDEHLQMECPLVRQSVPYAGRPFPDTASVHGSTAKLNRHECPKGEKGTVREYLGTIWTRPVGATSPPFSAVSRWTSPRTRRRTCRPESQCFLAIRSWPTSSPPSTRRSTARNRRSRRGRSTDRPRPDRTKIFTDGRFLAPWTLVTVPFGRASMHGCCVWKRASSVLRDCRTGGHSICRCSSLA